VTSAFGGQGEASIMDNLGRLNQHNTSDFSLRLSGFVP
jgi:hypothetical protein